MVLHSYFGMNSPIALHLHHELCLFVTSINWLFILIPFLLVLFSSLINPILFLISWIPITNQFPRLTRTSTLPLNAHLHHRWRVYWLLIVFYLAPFFSCSDDVVAWKLIRLPPINEIFPSQIIVERAALCCCSTHYCIVGERCHCYVMLLLSCSIKSIGITSVNSQSWNGNQKIKWSRQIWSLK